MKYLAPLLVLWGLVCLTAPNGLGVWVAKDQVISVGHAAGCSPGAKSQVYTSNGTLCVVETPQEVVKKFDDAK